MIAPKLQVNLTSEQELSAWDVVCAEYRGKKAKMSNSEILSKLIVQEARYIDRREKHSRLTETWLMMRDMYMLMRMGKMELKVSDDEDTQAILRELEERVQASDRA